MRTKNRKRIGPVPIALVAVFALVAFISAGFWLVPGGANVTEAQGGGGAKSLPTADSAKKCGLVVLTGAENATLTSGMLITGPKCDVSGDSVDVVFENTNEMVFTDARPAGVSLNGEVSMVVYTTGGDEFPSVQALVSDGTNEPDDDDMLPDAAGRVGVDEDLLTIPKQSDLFGTKTPGSKTITVSRSMAGDDGKVYLFGFYHNNDGVTDLAENYLIDGKFDADRNGVIDGDDDRDGTPGDAATNGVDIASDSDLDMSSIVDGGFDVNADGDVNTNDDYTGMDFVIINGVFYMTDLGTGSKLVRLGTYTTADGVVKPITLIAGKADVNGSGVIEEADTADTRDGGAVTSDNLTNAAIIDGKIDVNADEDIDTTNTELDDYDGANFVIRDGLIRTKVLITGPFPSGIDLGANAATTSGLDDDFIRASAYHVPFAPGTESYFPRVFTDNSGNPKSTGIQADIVVLVRFQNPPSAEKGSDGKALSSVKGSPVSSTGTSDLTVTISDANGVGLNGFATLTIAEDAGATVLFTESNLKTYRAEIEDGTGMAEVKGLPKSGAVRVKVTATFGDFEVPGYVQRLGRAATLDVKTYSCVTKIGNLNLMGDDLCRIEAGTKAEDLTEATSFAPGDKFLIVGTLKDAADNTLNKKINSKQLQPSGTTKAIETTNVDVGPKVRSMITSPEYPEVTAVHANSRMYATVDKNEANAQLGSYDIELSGDGQKMTVTVTIAGEVSQISVDGPERIPTASGVGTFTVKATDANDNVPTNVGANVEDTDSHFEALVSVRPTTSKVLGTEEGKFTFNAKTGEATFFVQVADDAEVGDSLTITVTAIGDSSIAPVTRTVTYGEAAPEPVAMPEAGMAMNLMATANDDDSIMLDWTAGMDANWHFLRGDEVGGDEAVVWTFTSASDSHMVPADMLTSGTEYSFIVIAGYFVKNDAGGWDGGWSAGWTTAAMATAMAGN